MCMCNFSIKEKTMSRIISVLIFVSVIIGCSQTGHYQKHTMLSYKDFGPPSLASELIGSDFWQWESHGDSRPKEYPISVVVYRNMELDQVKALFPVIKEKKQDYRYVEHQKAVMFLNGSIEELQSNKDFAPSRLLKTLIGTRDKIQSTLGDIVKSK